MSVYRCEVTLYDDIGDPKGSCAAAFPTAAARRDHRRHVHKIRDHKITAAQLSRLLQLQRLTNEYELIGGAKANEDLSDYEADALIEKHERALIEHDRKATG